MRLAPILLAVLAVLPGCITGSLQGEVDTALAQLVASPDLAGGRVGVLVFDPEADTVLGESMADLGFAPASNQKLISSLVAFETLGVEHRLQTRVFADGQVVEGRLLGNLHLVGGGDPTFAERERAEAQWQMIAQSLRAHGIERVTGRVIGDGSSQGATTLGHGWQWDYLADDYAAPFGGLCAAGNVIELRVMPDAGGAKVDVWPPLPDPERWFVDEVALATDEASSRVTVTRPLGQQRIRIAGELGAAGATGVHRIAVADPVRFAEAVATAGLRRAGIAIDGEDVPAGRDLVEVATADSPELLAIARPLLTDSNNLYAEQLFRVAARTATGDGDTRAAEKHAKTVLARLGVDIRGLVMADGSGLSRRNLVTPRQLVSVLRAVHRASYRYSFVDCLPTAGQTGTLRSRFAAGPAHGRVRAKTGFISRVVCLSGFVPRPEGQPLLFSVMLNDFTCETAVAKAAVDRFVHRLAGAVGW